MSYMTVIGYCANCGGMMNFHPHKVPSVTIKGHREPVCRACIERVNPIRVEKGLPAIPIQSGAYDAAPESEL